MFFMKNLIKIRQSVFKGVIKPKIFLILFAFIFSSLAFAATLTVTWLDGRIPGGNANCKSFDNEPYVGYVRDDRAFRRGRRSRR